MLHGSHSPGVAGSELTRLLARLADNAPSDPARPAFADRLGHWLSWTGAISLSTALNTIPAALAANRAHKPGSEASDFERVRAGLDTSIAAGPQETAVDPADFGPQRRHCLSQQQAMQEAVAALRQRLRDALSRCSAQAARLAAVDAVMDQALAAQERGLLGLVPLRLQAHFERLQRASAARDADPHLAPSMTRWQDSFHLDMTQLLRAELAHRLLPSRGLLDTLLTHPPK